MVAACDVKLHFLEDLEQWFNALNNIGRQLTFYGSVSIKRYGHKILNFFSYDINLTNDVKEVKEYVENTITEMVVRIMNNKILIACGKKRCV